MEIWREWLSLLVRRDIGRNKIYARQVKSVMGRPSQCNMPLVDGIESSAEKTDVHFVAARLFRGILAKGCLLRFFLMAIGNWALIA